MVVHADFHKMIKKTAANKEVSIISLTERLSKEAKKDEEELQKKIFKMRF